METNGILVSASIWLCAASLALAGVGSTAAKSVVAPTPAGDVNQLDVINLDTSYTFTSSIKFASQRIGSGDEVHSAFEYLRRVPIRGNWYFQMGVHYERFDFGNSTTGAAGALPGALQEISAPIGVVYLVQNEIGFLAQIRPGVFFEHNIDLGAVDIPFELGGVYPIKDKKFYLVYGLSTTALREYPVLPDLGFVWLISPKMRLVAAAPDPRFTYTCSDRFSWWVGGELLTGTYKTDTNTNALFAPNDQTTSGSVVEYTEIRAAIGATYSPIDNWDLNVAAGYSLQREFTYYRANKSYTADPAPFVRIEMKASF